MAITKSWEHTPVSLTLIEKTTPIERRREFVWLLGASLLVACGLALVYFAKTQEFAGMSTRLAHGELLNLNSVTSTDEILPFLAIFDDPAERELVAGRVLAYIQANRPLANVGALARLHLTQTEIEADPRWNALRTELQARVAHSPTTGNRESRIALLPLAKLKPQMIVRTPREFSQQYSLWCLIYLVSFWMVHLLWRSRQFHGDAAILPALQMLTGIGLILAVSLRDPLRDTLEFRKFAWGAALGCCLLLLPLLRVFHYQRFSRWTYTPLLAAFALFLLLLLRGTGPTGSDARVNLGPFQPVELIKILLVLFMAGYFAGKWEWLRELSEKKLVPRPLRWLAIPRVAHALPVMLGVSGALLLFFFLKDLGPALVMGFLFLVMFAVARDRAGLALLGIALLIAGVTIGCHYGKPATVVDRVSMWLSPWDNNVRGGDQLAHSLWAFSAGGAWGSGPGWGDPSMIPAGHTDLVLPAIGEEWGFAGVIAVGVLFLFLVRCAFRIALRAPDEYAMFLALGLGALIALEMLLISGGVLGAIPLSGVVSPFLSSGNTAMLANFLIFAFLLGISNQQTRSGGNLRPLFLPPVRAVSVVLGVLGLVLAGKAAYFQVLHDREFLVHDALVIQEDGVKRPQYNPRLSSLAREIPRGSIYDRNGLPLATSSWDELEQHRTDYDKLGVSIEQVCTRLENRHYPFGVETIHLLGDLRTGDKFHATNASLIEHDSNARLQGYTDIHELGPLVRYRHQPLNPGMQALLARDRSVRASVDIRLQKRVDELLRQRLQPAGKSGAVVVMDPRTGDVLALASFPTPLPGSPATPDQLLDRARYGQYPPGSTFKLVTAIAALRLNPELSKKAYTCRRLPDGRSGTMVRGWRRPIRDDIGDSAHGSLSMARAIMVSCNAYFAQLGTYDVGARPLHDTAALLGIPAGEIPEIQKMMPFAAYGQGPVLVTPFKMARVAATIGTGGTMPQGRWILDESSTRTDPPRSILPTPLAGFIADAMRSAVTSGTGRHAMAGLNISVAGKTGTAQVEKGAPHSWFAGFAPYGADPGRQIAFSVVVEHGGYGAQFAAPIARQIVEAARDLGMITELSSTRK
ncbi:MAG TPA: FtsW/RodA/SpoVE family cell cycle protein [Bryobacteraceae bacterium]|nr:FtsW/RodA/SpoVE family cell cycle protein [Bryobacteraceae bacterium]